MRSILKFQTTAGVRAGNYLRLLVLAPILLLVGSPLADRVDAHDLYTPDKVQQEIDVLATTIGRYENRNRSDLKPSPDRSKLSTEKKSATNAGELFKKAEIAYLAGQDSLAIDEFKSFLFSHPGNDLGALAQIRLAQLYLEQGNSDLARTHLLEARWLHRQRLVSKEKSDDTAENRSGTRSQISDRESAQLTSDGLSGFSKPEISQNVGRPQNAIDQFATDVGDRIFFDSDSSDLSPASQKVLRNQAQWLKKYPKIALTLVGHSDERGTRAYNLALGARRAEMVREFLIDSGVGEKRIRILSYGKERPVALCNDAKCWAQNRRVVTRLNLPETAIAEQTEPSDKKESEFQQKTGKKIQI